MSRVLSALALLPIVIGIIWFLPPIGTVVLAHVIVLVAFWEYADLAARSGAPFPKAIPAVAALGTCAAFSMAPSAVPVVLMGALVAIATVHLAQGRSRIRWRRCRPPYSGRVSGGPDRCHRIASGHCGAEVALLLLFTVMASDTMQYYGGRLFGRRPLAAVSPKKTVEGAVFGLAAGILVLWLAGRWWLADTAPVLRILLGAAVAGLGIAGDLFESRSSGSRA